MTFHRIGLDYFAWQDNEARQAAVDKRLEERERYGEPSMATDEVQKLKTMLAFFVTYCNCELENENNRRNESWWKTLRARTDEAAAYLKITDLMKDTEICER